ncbi:MAG: hypothetical protein Q7S52_01610 [bacterium]|nr:hypothetical protein [bacterium]
MIKLRTFNLGIACVAGILLFPSIALAALDVVTFSTNPPNPSPNQPVTVSIQSFAINLNSAKITWYVDKEVVKDGIAEKSIQTNTKAFGQTVTIDVVIVDQTGVRTDKKFLLRPIEIDILWEADTYTSPFYKGKALPSYKSNVKAMAMARMRSLSDDPSSFYYTWTINRIQGLGEGLGKTSAVIPMKYAGSAVPVSVRVSDLSKEGGGGGQSWSGMQNILAVSPTLLFYEQAPLLGTLLERALSGGISTKGTSFRIRAVPYFFSLDDMASGNLVYTWKKDGQSTAPALNPTSIQLGKTGTGAETSIISLSIQNRKRILQSANAQVTVNFSQE